ncbi:hypothetical protein GKJPGBOP_02869 [Streptomyces paromomycinus]|uniref:FtsX-like permease family protein n=2 Tax=Streptomyces paromomycinus TaxID=92743 RepID=A0A401W1J4_STREY|nr:hypothetical protein GKJPGBOP_02869 [Streptomyces paromomycinus]
MLLLIGFSLVLPAGILVVVAVRTGAHYRDRREALIESLGGSSRDRALMAIGEVATPVALGSGLAAFPLTALLARNCRIPVVDYLTSAEDMRQWAWLLTSSLLLAVILVAVSASLPQCASQFSQRSTRPRKKHRVPPQTALLFPIALLLAVRGPDFFPTGTGNFMLAIYCGTGLALITLPLCIAAGTAAIGNPLARKGRAMGSPATVLAGRRYATHPGPIARLVSGLVIAIALLIQIYAWNGYMGLPARQAEETRHRIGDSLVVAQNSPALTEAQVKHVLQASPVPTEAAALIASPDSNHLQVQASCTALTTLKLPCIETELPPGAGYNDPRLDELLRWFSDETARVTVRPGSVAQALTAKDSSRQLILVSSDGRALPTAPFKKIFYEMRPMGVDVDYLGESWLRPALVREKQGNWIVLFGAAGVLVLSLAFGFAGLAELTRAGRALTPLSVLTANHRVLALATAWNVLIPMALAALTGAMFGTWLATPLATAGGSSIPNSLLGSIVLAVTVIAIGLWAYGVRTAHAMANSWRPNGE